MGGEQSSSLEDGSSPLNLPWKIPAQTYTKYALLIIWALLNTNKLTIKMNHNTWNEKPLPEATEKKKYS
jgi:hypothetical protein